MIHDVVLPTEHEPQFKNYTCGAACVVMVLSRWGLKPDQWGVWTDIQANTGTLLRPDNAPWPDGSFPTQRCDQCNDDTWIGADGKVYGNYHCWFTSPEAMAATINALSPSPVAVGYIANGADVLRRLADSISVHGVPAVFTTAPALHWVVAVGFRFDDVQPSGAGFVNWGTKYLTGFYVRNPSDEAVSPDTVCMVTPPRLSGIDGLLTRIVCGPHTGCCPVVAGTGAGASTGGASISRASHHRRGRP